MQAMTMKQKWPFLKVLSLKADKIKWRGTIQPTPISQEYEVEIHFRLDEKPTIKVLSPRLEFAEGAEKLPHVYTGDLLCLYYPRYKEWTNTKQVADTLVPWTYLWLFHYEIWMMTGKWHGGGKHPNLERRNG